MLDNHLAGRDFIAGKEYTIADMSAWGWIERAHMVMKGKDEPLEGFPHLARWYDFINERPAVERARKVGSDHAFKTETDDIAKRALFPSNYPEA